MTLTDYCNQENPIRFPRVDIMPSEYRILATIKAGQDTLTSIEIPLLWEKFGCFGYVLKNDCSTVYATDEGGNPRRATCFSIQGK